MKTKCLLYCTKADPLLVRNNIAKKYHLDCCYFETYETPLNGTIALECEVECEEIKDYCSAYLYDSVDCEYNNELLKKSCLKCCELFNYLYQEKYHNKNTDNYSNSSDGCALHISNLKVFDRPLQLNEVKTLEKQKAYEKALEEAYEEDCKIADRIACDIANEDEIDNCVELTEYTEWTYGLKKAPQNMCWVWYKGERYCLISIRSPWYCKIANGEKTVEVRKKILKGMI